MGQIFLLRLLIGLGAAGLTAGAVRLHHAKTTGLPAVSSVQISHSTATAVSAASDVEGSLLNQGQNRTYYLHTPAAANRPLPLVVALHGTGTQGKDLAEKTALSQLADRAGFIVVYPDAIRQRWNVSGATPEDNVAFVHALIQQVQRERAIDPQRIYVVGLSNGGILAQKLACEAPDGIAAIATVAASLPNQFAARCQTKTPLPILMVNGTADTVVPWNGGAVGRHPLAVPKIPEAIEFWRQHNGCKAPAQVTAVSEVVSVTAYSSCQAEVMLVALQGAEHTWAGGGYGQSVFGDTTDRVWQFLQRQVLASGSTPKT
jgi:polyhydroxybutyrate depolymerase